jgi:hypothetical protein
MESLVPLTLSRRILSMRYQGYEVPDIAHILDLSPSAVRSNIDRAAAATADEYRATIVREAELLKLEEMESPFLATAAEGDHKSAMVVLKLMERRAALLGSDKAPSPGQVPGGGNVYNLVTVLASMSRQSHSPKFETIDST